MLFEKKKTELRSALKQEPLPQAGESLRWEILDALDSLDSWTVVALAGVAIVLMDWMRYLLKLPIMPWITTGLGMIVCAMVGLRWYRVWPKLKDFNEGAKGERAVADVLDELRAKNYLVLHDVIGAGFNVDHVAVGPGGVFAIETKTWRKPGDRDAQIDYDGARITVDGDDRKADPVKQARASADFVRDIIKQTCGRDQFVRPVVLFPGWYVNEPSQRPEVWVLNPTRFLGYAANEAKRLDAEDIALFCNRLKLVSREARERAK